MDNKARNDATSSKLGDIYQLCVALQKTFELDDRESLWIEKFGDVTVPEQQLEVKHIKRPLRDRDEGFWNTLKSWVSPIFDHSAYKTLIFYTTQQFGSNCQLKDWNTLGEERRFNILSSIFKEAEDTFLAKQTSSKKKNKTKNEEVPPPLVLKIQRDVFKQEKTLKEIINKITVACGTPRVGDLYDKIMSQYIAGIPDKNKHHVMNGLLGFIINPEKIQNNTWQIRKDDFNRYFIELTAKYNAGIVRFPRKYIDKEVDSYRVQSQNNKLFVSKIREIEYEDAVLDAISDYIKTTDTIINELLSCESDRSDYHRYKSDLKINHSVKYRMGSRNVHVDNVISASQSFYDEMISNNADRFGVFQDETPRQFRNGIYHILADDDNGNIHWKLLK